MVDKRRGCAAVESVAITAEGEELFAVFHTARGAYWCKVENDFISTLDTKHDRRLDRPGEQGDPVEGERNDEAHSTGDADTGAVDVDTLAEEISNAIYIEACVSVQWRDQFEEIIRESLLYRWPSGRIPSHAAPHVRDVDGAGGRANDGDRGLDRGHGADRGPGVPAPQPGPHEARESGDGEKLVN